MWYREILSADTTSSIYLPEVVHVLKYTKMLAIMEVGQLPNRDSCGQLSHAPASSHLSTFPDYRPFLLPRRQALLEGTSSPRLSWHIPT